MFNPKKLDLSLEPINVQPYAPPCAPAKPFAAYSNAESTYSIINEWLIMRGDLESSGDILVKGKVHGNIRCRMLIIDTDAQVEGRIDCEEIVVRGATTGLIRSARVRVEAPGRVHSEIYSDSFASEEGARVRGSLHDLNDAPDTFAAIQSNGEAKWHRSEFGANGFTRLEAAE